MTIFFFSLMEYSWGRVVAGYSREGTLYLTL